MRSPFRTAVFLFVLLILFTTASSAREKIAIAVLDFEAKNINQQNAEAVADLLRTELFNTGSFKVVERAKIRKIIEAMDEHGRWITNDTIRSQTFVRHFNILCSAAELLQTKNDR